MPGYFLYGGRATSGTREKLLNEPGIAKNPLAEARSLEDFFPCNQSSRVVRRNGKEKCDTFCRVKGIAGNQFDRFTGDPVRNDSDRYLCRRDRPGRKSGGNSDQGGRNVTPASCRQYRERPASICAGRDAHTTGLSVLHFYFSRTLLAPEVLFSIFLGFPE